MLTFKGALHPRRRHSPHQIQRREELWIRHLQSRGERASGVEEEQAAVMPNKKRVRSQEVSLYVSNLRASLHDTQRSARCSSFDSKPSAASHAMKKRLQDFPPRKWRPSD